MAAIGGTPLDLKQPSDIPCGQEVDACDHRLLIGAIVIRSWQMSVALEQLVTLWRHRCAHCCPVRPGMCFATAAHLHAKDNQCGNSVQRQSSPACAAALRKHHGSRTASHLLPSCPCHSASARSSAGSQLPVRTGSPFTVVGIGMLYQLTGRRLH